MARLAVSIKSLLERPDADRRLGPFLLVSALGRGGFAPVWLAKEIYGATELRTAAVKLFSLDPHAGEDGPRSSGPTSTAARDRIVEEARALCQVEHPNVVRFYALPIDESCGVMGLAMEYVAGTPLDKRLDVDQRLSIAGTLAVGIAIASALSAVHRAGLVHRDVKPGNVIEAAGIYKLIDFGIAAADALGAKKPRENRKPKVIMLDDLPLEIGGTKISTIEGGVTQGPISSTSSDPSSLGVRCGTVGYIDPVVVSTGVPATPSSDLYALGAMLFECLTGKVPAAARMPDGRGLKGEVLDGRAPAPPLLEIAPEAPPSLARLIDALLAPDRRARPTSAEWVAIRLEQVRHELAGVARALPPEDVGPFRGLGRFEAGDRDVYFGRASEVAAALETLRSRGVAALIGPSGSGKSSLARAGVLPAIAEGGLGGWPKKWDTAVVEPGADPRAAIAAVLARFVPGARDLSPEALVVALADRAQRDSTGVALLVDQLEEVATIASGPSQAWAVALLGRLGEQALPGVRVVVAARRDLLDPLLALGGLGRALTRGLVLIEPITDVTWGDVLDQALAAYGYALEDDALKGELLADLKLTASAMPLVQFALTELWHKRDRDTKKVTRSGLHAIGGIAGALERHADATLAEIADAHPGAELSARSVLLALTTPQGTRAARKMSELEAAAGPGHGAVIEAFERARLIVPGPGGVTLAHEALLTQWGKLRGWVAEAREDRLLAEELERDAEKWHSDPEAVPLWQRRRLVFASFLSRRGGVHLSPRALEFLKLSERAERRNRWLAFGLAAAMLLSLGGGAIAYVHAVQAQEETSRLKLIEEQTSREQAERQMHEVQAKQLKIDELLRDLADSPKKETVLALQRQIREAETQSSPESKEKPAPVLASTGRPLASMPTAAATAAAGAATAVSTARPAVSAAPSIPVIKQQTDWE
jgi:eukaryotic-like serine/threonine-protein kinase